MSRDAQPSIAFSIASARASSTRKSAGPPMPKEVREASGSSSLTPGCSRSHARLVLVRQVIAQLLDIARAHEQNEVVRADDLESHRGRRGRVLDIVAAGLPQVDVSQQVDAAIDRKRTGMLAAIRRALAKAICDLSCLRLELARELVIRAQHREPALRQAFDEPLEQVADRAHVAEVVGMVELDVRDDRPLRAV